MRRKANKGTVWKSLLSLRCLSFYKKNKQLSLILHFWLSMLTLNYRSHESPVYYCFIIIIIVVIISQCFRTLYRSYTVFHYNISASFTTVNKKEMSVETILQCTTNTTGEGPHWDDTTQSLLFVNIEDGTIHRWDSKTGNHETHKFGKHD